MKRDGEIRGIVEKDEEEDQVEKEGGWHQAFKDNQAVDDTDFGAMWSLD